jgi:MoaA/NifB/PqqE/SkfB family radical SAM enzyme
VPDRPRAQHVAGKGILTLPLYCKILDQLPKLRTLLLFNWGEPLLHPQIEEIIAIAQPARDRPCTRTRTSRSRRTTPSSSG